MNRLASLVPLDPKNTATHFSLRPGASLNSTQIKDLLADLPLGFHIEAHNSNQLSIIPSRELADEQGAPSEISPLPPILAPLDGLFQNIFTYLPTNPRAAKSKAGKPLIRCCMPLGVSSEVLQKITEAGGAPVVLASCGRVYLHVGKQ